MNQKQPNNKPLTINVGVNQEASTLSCTWRITKILDTTTGENVNAIDLENKRS